MKTAEREHNLWWHRNILAVLGHSGATGDSVGIVTLHVCETEVFRA